VSQSHPVLPTLLTMAGYRYPPTGACGYPPTNANGNPPTNAYGCPRTNSYGYPPADAPRYSRAERPEILARRRLQASASSRRLSFHYYQEIGRCLRILARIRGLCFHHNQERRDRSIQSTGRSRQETARPGQLAPNYGQAYFRQRSQLVLRQGHPLSSNKDATPKPPR
jgi:hypothetical protein